MEVYNVPSFNNLSGNISAEFVCNQAFEEELFNIHKFTQPYNLDFIHQVRSIFYTYLLP